MADDSSSPPLLRTALYVPGDKPRAIEKAPGLGADALMLDLEDAVAPERKAEARAAAPAAIAAFKSSRAYSVLRVADPAAPELDADLITAARAQPHAVLVAKLESAAQLEAVRRRLDAAGFAGPLWAMIETPRGVMEADAIVRVARLHRLDALIAGANDLAEQLRLPAGATQRSALTPHLARLVLAARAGGLRVLDGVYNAYTDTDGLAREAAEGRALGFDGKTLIHPSQVAPVKAAYAPSADELAWAQEVVAAFAAPDNAGKGAVALQGRMIETMHLTAARAVLAAAETGD